MYISGSPDQLPSFLPLNTTFALSNWFERKALDQGFELIRQKKVRHFFIYRNAAACCIASTSLATVTFEKTHRTAEGFTLSSSHCPLCEAHASRKARCGHLAALCILSLHEQAAGNSLPLPLLFKQSAWSTLAEYLFTWLGKEVPQTQNDAQTLTLYLSPAEGSLQLEIEQTPYIATGLLLPDGAQEIQTVFQQLQQRSLSANEKQLLKAGATSKGLQLDSSLWSRLCSLAFCCMPELSPSVRYSESKRAFQLTVVSDQPDFRLTLTLPAQGTVGLFKKLNILEGNFPCLPDGRSGSEVTLNAEGNLCIRPLAWIDEEEPLLLSTLQNQKFGTHYFLPQRGFFRLAPGKAEAKITVHQKQQAATPLFALLPQSLEQIVVQKDIAHFLENNQAQLLHKDNLVAPEIHKIRFIHLPDSLVLTELREENNWLAISCRFVIDDHTYRLVELASLHKKCKPLRHGQTTLVMATGPFSWLYERMTQKAPTTTNDSADTLYLRRGEFACLLGAVSNIQHQHGNPRLQQAVAQLTSYTQPLYNPALGSQKQLREYQKMGLSWLYALYELGLGGLLADDMGLGKTHQAMALIDFILQKTATTGTILVICPASVLLHWADKLKRFYSHLPVALYHGPNRNVKEALNQQLILTTYAIARADHEALGQHTFDLIIYDEIQALKNRETATHLACSNLQARVVFGLSGTPIENSLADLFALFSICLPGFFGTFKLFQRIFLLPIEEHASSNALTALQQRIAPFVLRRTRSQVLLELPELIEDNRCCTLSGQQLKLYRQTLAAQQPLLVDIAQHENPIDYLHVFAMLNRLKQICNHPCLVAGGKDPEQFRSGKWDLFVELLQEAMENGSKVVVFSQYLGMLTLMEHHLRASAVGFTHLAR